VGGAFSVHISTAFRWNINKPLGELDRIYRKKLALSCGADGTQYFDTWLSLSWDHLLPKGHPNRDNPDYIVAACNFCNTADNHFFEHAEKRGLKFDGLTPDELVAQRLPYVLETRRKYREFWETVVLKHEPKES